MPSQLKGITIMLVMFNLTVASISSGVERTGFSTERTAVWLLGHNSKPRFRLLLWPWRVSFGHFWHHPTVPSTETSHCFCSSVSNQGINVTEICLMFKSTIRNHWHVSHERPTCQWSLKWYFIGHRWQFVNFFHIFICVTCGGMTWMLTIFNHNFPTFWIEKTT
jgi:hypothetical protein